MGIIKLAAHNANREDKIRLRNALQKLDEAGKRWKQMRKSMPI